MVVENVLIRGVLIRLGRGEVGRREFGCREFGGGEVDHPVTGGQLLGAAGRRPRHTPLAPTTWNTVHRPTVMAPEIRQRPGRMVAASELNRRTGGRPRKSSRALMTSLRRARCSMRGAREQW